MNHMRSPRLTKPTGRTAAACTALLASIAALASTPAPAATGSAAAQKCRTSGLDVWLNNESGGAAAGSVYYKLEFTNLSGHTCAIRGFPGVSAVNLGGGKIGKPAIRDTPQTSGSVTLAAGASATSILRIVDAGNFPASSCHQVTAAGLRVFPPGQTASRLVPFPFQTCSATGVSVLAVRALAKA